MLFLEVNCFKYIDFSLRLQEKTYLTFIMLCFRLEFLDFYIADPLFSPVKYKLILCGFGVPFFFFFLSCHLFQTSDTREVQTRTISFLKVLPGRHFGHL